MLRCADPFNNIGMKPSDHLQAEVRALELTILRFISTLLPLGQLDGAALEDKHVLIVTHSLAHAAIIHLHQRFAQDDSIAYDKCSQAASACVSVIKHTGDMDFDFLDPIIGVCTFFLMLDLPSDHSVALLDQCI